MKWMEGEIINEERKREGELTRTLTDSITSRNTSFLRYLTPSFLQDTALVTAAGT